MGDDNDGQLSTNVRSSLGWSVTSQLAVRLVTVASTVVLLRLLTPADFGVYTFAFAVVTILMAVNDAGQLMAITRWPTEPGRAASVATTVSWVFSLAAFAACISAAPLLARAAGDPAATGVIRLISVLLLIDGVTTVPRALLFRSFKHRRVAVTDLAGVGANVSVALGLAAAGAGPWAPAAGTVAAAALTGALVAAFAPRIPRPGWDPAVARRLVGFGAPVALANLVELTLLNVDYLIVANVLGATALGLYAVAFNVASWPANLLTQAIRRVSVPGYSQLSGDRSELGRNFARNLTVLVTGLLVVCAALAVHAEPLLRFLYGPEIAAAAPALSWLVALGGIRVAIGLVVDVLLADGRSRAAARLQIVWLVTVVPALVAGSVGWGIAGVAAAHTAVAAVVALPLALRTLRPLGVSAGELVRPLLRPAAAAVLATAAGLAVGPALTSPLVHVVVGGGLMAALYGATAVPRKELRAQLARIQPVRAR